MLLNCFPHSDTMCWLKGMRAHTHTHMHTLVCGPFSGSRYASIHEKLQPKNTCFNVIKVWLMYSVRYCLLIKCVQVRKLNEFSLCMLLPIPYSQHTIIIMSHSSQQHHRHRCWLLLHRCRCRVPSAYLHSLRCQKSSAQFFVSPF